MPSNARTRTNVILAGNVVAVVSCTASFSENVVVAQTSYQMLGILSFSDRERASPPSTEISVLTGVYILKNRLEKLNVVLVVVLASSSKLKRARRGPRQTKCESCLPKGKAVQNQVFSNPRVVSKHEL